MSTSQVSTQFLLASIEKSMSKIHELLPSHKQIIRKIMKKKPSGSLTLLLKMAPL